MSDLDGTSRITITPPFDAVAPRRVSGHKKTMTQKEIPVAKLTIRGLSELNDEERLALGTWLHDRAIDILSPDQCNEKYAKVFVARFFK